MCICVSDMIVSEGRMHLGTRVSLWLCLLGGELAQCVGRTWCACILPLDLYVSSYVWICTCVCGSICVYRSGCTFFSVCNFVPASFYVHLPLSACLCHSTLSSFSTPHQSHHLVFQIFFCIYSGILPFSVSSFFSNVFFSWLHSFSLLDYLSLSQLPGSFPNSFLSTLWVPGLSLSSCLVSDRGEPYKSLSFL